MGMGLGCRGGSPLTQRRMGTVLVLLGAAHWGTACTAGGEGQETASGAAPRTPASPTPSSVAPSPLPGMCIILQPHFRAT